MTGTDEHGLKIQKAAKEKGVTPLQLCDDLSQVFRVCFSVISVKVLLTWAKTLTRKADVVNHTFMRTTSKDHVSGAVHFWVG